MALVFVMAVTMAATHIHSRFHSFRVSTASYSCRANHSYCECVSTKSMPSPQGNIFQPSSPTSLPGLSVSLSLSPSLPLQLRLYVFSSHNTENPGGIPVSWGLRDFWSPNQSKGHGSLCLPVLAIPIILPALICCSDTNCLQVALSIIR